MKMEISQLIRINYLLGSEVDSLRIQVGYEI
jgi:hypothetical protein